MLLIPHSSNLCLMLLDAILPLSDSAPLSCIRPLSRLRLSWRMPFRSLFALWFLRVLPPVVLDLLDLFLQLFLLLFLLSLMDSILNLFFCLLRSLLGLMARFRRCILGCISQLVLSILFRGNLSIVHQILDLILCPYSSLFQALCNLGRLVQGFDIVFHFTGLNSFSGILTHCTTFLATTTRRPFLYVYSQVESVSS